MIEELFIAQLRKSLQEMHGPEIELFSRELVHDFTFLKFRVASGRFSGDRWYCAVDFLIHHLMDEAQRSTIFSSPYDLGSRIQLEKHEVKQKQIEESLNSYAMFESDEPEQKPINIEDIIKKLKIFILEMTGSSYRDYTGPCETSLDEDLNSSVATKVLFTLFRFRRKWPKFFLRYAKPDFEGKASLELRDAHPLEGFDDIAKLGVELHADLKVALSYGMTSDEISTILPTLEQISLRFETSSMPSPQLMLQINNGHSRPPTLPTTKELQDMLPGGPRKLPERLDKSIYTALVMREVENRVAAKWYINEFLQSSESRIPQIHADENHMYNLIISKRRNDKNGYINTLSKIIGKTVSTKQFDAAHELQLHLRYIIKKPTEDFLLNHLEYLGSIITCIELDEKPVEIKAYWHGKTTTSNRPKYFLQKISSHNELKIIPEFYQEYWFRRYSLICSRLQKAEELWKSFNKTERLEYEHINTVIKTHELTNACLLIQNYVNKFPKLFY